MKRDKSSEGNINISKERYELFKQYVQAEAASYCKNQKLIKSCFALIDKDLKNNFEKPVCHEKFRKLSKIIKKQAALYEPEDIGIDDDTEDYEKAIAYYSIAYGIHKYLYNQAHSIENIEGLFVSMYDVGVPLENSGKYNLAYQCYNEILPLLAELTELYIDKRNITPLELLSELKEPAVFLDSVQKRIVHIKQYVDDELLSEIYSNELIVPVSESCFEYYHLLQKLQEEQYPKEIYDMFCEYCRKKNG